MTFQKKIWDVILPIDELHDFSRWLKPPASISGHRDDLPMKHGGIFPSEFSENDSDPDMNVQRVQQSFQTFYPLVNVYIAMERSTICKGKIHYFYGHFQ